MNVGIIGFGLMGKQRASDILDLPMHRLIILCDNNSDQFKDFDFGTQNNIVFTNDWKDVIENKKVELIVISVPHYLTKEITCDALMKGKNILCEKPLGMNPKEVNIILKTLNRTSGLLEPGFNYRFYPGILKTKKIIDDGHIGQVRHVRCTFGHGGRPGMDKEWKINKDLAGGGVLLDPGIHAIDLFRFLFGEICEGFATFKNTFWKVNAEDNVFLNLHTINNVFIQSHFSTTEWKNKFRLEIFGDDACVTISGRSKTYGPQEVRLTKRWFWLNNEKEKLWVFPKEDVSFKNELLAFINLIKGNENSVLATPNDASKAIKIIDKLYKYPEEKVKL